MSYGAIISILSILLLIETFISSKFVRDAQKTTDRAFEIVCNCEEQYKNFSKLCSDVMKHYDICIEHVDAAEKYYDILNGQYETIRTYFNIKQEEM